MPLTKYSPVTLVFSPRKAAQCEQVEKMEQGGVKTVGKERFTYLYSPA
jgi:hypothetical protein